MCRTAVPSHKGKFALIRDFHRFPFPTPLAAGPLHTFEEHTLGMNIQIFGNIAVVLAASEMLENETETNQDVSGYLLVKDEGTWSIAAHAWDQASEEKPVPKALL